MDDVENLLNKKYITRRMKQKLLNIIEKRSLSIEDFPEKFRPRVAQILMDQDTSVKRKQPENSFENPNPKRRRITKKEESEKQEMEDLLKDLIKKDIEKDIQEKPHRTFLDFLMTPNDKQIPILDFTLQVDDNGDMVIFDEDYDSDDEDYTEQDAAEEEELSRRGEFLQIFGNSTFKSGKKKKEELDLRCIEDEEEKEKIKEIYENIKKMNNVEMPLKIKVLTSDLPLKTKATIVKKLEMLNNSFDSGDSKKFYDWIESLLKIPFNKYCNMPISNDSPKEEIGKFLDNFYNNLDKAIYGHKKVKQVLTETIAKWITHPTTKGHALAIVGPPGVGKTSLIREGLAKGLNRPFCSMSLAGMHDEAYLTGFALTYEGSQEGRIAKMLKNSGCMNPIIFMDELDKVDTVRHGLSIMNKLIEITDFSQNHEFEDLYYQDVKLDLSKSIFVFSLNHLENVDPILRDRLEIIHVDGFEPKEKVSIAKDYLIPSILKQFGFNDGDIIFDTKIIKYINLQLDDEKGVRKLKEAIIKICRKINILRFTKENTDFKKTYELPITVTQDMIDKILIKPENPFLHMYI